MDQIKGALTKKIGPFPGWAWAGIVAVGAFLVWPMIAGGLSSAGNAASSGSSGSSGNPGSGYPPPPGPPPPPPPPPPPADPLNSYGYPTSLWAKLTEHQKEYWKLHHKLPPVGGGPSISSRSSWLMSPWHPGIKQGVRYPQLLRAVGGPAAHSANLARLAAQTGVHPARLQALNPHYTGFVRIA